MKSHQNVLRAAFIAAVLVASADSALAYPLCSSVATKGGYVFEKDFGNSTAGAGFSAGARTTYNPWCSMLFFNMQPLFTSETICQGRLVIAGKTAKIGVRAYAYDQNANRNASVEACFLNSYYVNRQNRLFASWTMPFPIPACKSSGTVYAGPVPIAVTLYITPSFTVNLYAKTDGALVSTGGYAFGKIDFSSSGGPGMSGAKVYIEVYGRLLDSSVVGQKSVTWLGEHSGAGTLSIRPYNIRMRICGQLGWATWCPVNFKVSDSYPHYYNL